MNMHRHRRFFCIVLSACACAATAVGAQTNGANPPLALRGVMDKLGHDMQAVTGAIAQEDWALVARLAPQIARHEEPPATEKIRILTWLGAQASKFRGLDQQVHDAAMAMGDAAQRGDGPAVIDAFARVQHSCLACHQGYRKAFAEHFYPAR
ncbi:MAG: cytochrome c [Proteobacteria bacterium]|nr:cytochrome c [Pseudomonadota bacterium]